MKQVTNTRNLSSQISKVCKAQGLVKHKIQGHKIIGDMSATRATTQEQQHKDTKKAQFITLNTDSKYLQKFRTVCCVIYINHQIILKTKQQLFEKCERRSNWKVKFEIGFL